MRYKFDHPPTEPLRYDYQLLRDAYKDAQAGNCIREFLLFVLGLALWVVGITGICMAMGLFQ